MPVILYTCFVRFRQYFHVPHFYQLKCMTVFTEYTFFSFGGLFPHWRPRDILKRIFLLFILKLFIHIYGAIQSLTAAILKGIVALSAMGTLTAKANEVYFWRFCKLQASGMQHFWKINGTQFMPRRWRFRMPEIISTLEIAKQTGVKLKLKVEKIGNWSRNSPAHFKLEGEQYGSD